MHFVDLGYFSYNAASLVYPDHCLPSSGDGDAIHPELGREWSGTRDYNPAACYIAVAVLLALVAVVLQHSEGFTQ
jgi:hypothetical protein